MEKLHTSELRLGGCKSLGQDLDLVGEVLVLTEGMNGFALEEPGCSC